MTSKLLRSTQIICQVNQQPQENDWLGNWVANPGFGGTTLVVFNGEKYTVNLHIQYIQSSYYWAWLYCILYMLLWWMANCYLWARPLFSEEPECSFLFPLFLFFSSTQLLALPHSSTLQTSVVNLTLLNQKSSSVLWFEIVGLHLYGYIKGNTRD